MDYSFLHKGHSALYPQHLKVEFINASVSREYFPKAVQSGQFNVWSACRIQKGLPQSCGRITEDTPGVALKQFR